ncbi:MAG: ABC transporter permease [Solirubrobacteraceae bacterium]|nr:ABC transporter permease [Solirubrobacteraceae bacterium]
MIRLALRNLLSRKRRTLLTALAVVVGVAQVTGAFVLTDSMNNQIDDLFASGSKGIEVVVAPKTDSNDPDPPTIPAATLEKVRGVDGVKSAAGEIFALTSILKPDGKPVSSGPPSFVASRSPAPFNSWKLTTGGWATANDEAVLDESTAKRVGWKVGDRVTVVGAEGAEQLKLTGTATFGGSSLGASVVITTMENAARLADHAGQFDDIVVDADTGVSAKELRDRVAEALTGTGYSVRTGEEQAQSQADDLKTALGFLQPVLLAFGIIALFVGSFVIVNTFSATLAQRSQELALLRALGATRRQVRNSVLFESLLIGIVAGVLGLFGGLLLAPGIIALFKSFGADLPAQGSVVETRTVIVALLVGPIVTMLAGLLPVRRAAAVPPIQAMRGDTSREEKARPGWLAWLIGLLAVASIVGALVANGSFAWILVGAGAVLTLVGTAALAPLVLAPIMKGVGAPVAASGSMGRLARLNTMRSPRRTTTTAGALMVGVALVTFVSVFAAGVSAIAKDAFSDRVRADLGLADSTNMGFPAQVEGLVRQDPDVKTAVGLSYGGFHKVNGGDGVPLTGIDAGLPDVYELKWVQGSDALLGQLGPRDVIADQSSSDDRVKTVKVGDELKVEERDGTRFSVTVRGIVDEGSSLLGGGLIGSRELLASGKQQARVQLGLVKLNDGVDQATAQRRIQASLKERYPIVDALTRKELEDKFVGQVNQLVSMIYAFLAFALLVSLLGISTTFTLTVQERRRELGMMRAIGTTRRQIRRLVRLEAILTGLLGGVLGVAVGLGFGALSARLLADDGFSFVVPVGSIIGVLIVAAVVAALAATLPARRAGKIHIVEALGVE